MSWRLSIDEKVDRSFRGFECPARPLALRQDQMEEVLLNLLDNACKFTSNGGSIEIKGYSFFWDRRRPQAGLPRMWNAAPGLPDAEFISLGYSRFWTGHSARSPGFDISNSTRATRIPRIVPEEVLVWQFVRWCSTAIRAASGPNP